MTTLSEGEKMVIKYNAIKTNVKYSKSSVTGAYTYRFSSGTVVELINMCRTYITYCS